MPHLKNNEIPATKQALAIAAVALVEDDEVNDDSAAQPPYSLSPIPTPKDGHAGFMDLVWESGIHQAQLLRDRPKLLAS